MANAKERAAAFREVAGLARKIRETNSVNERARLSRDLQKASQRATEQSDDGSDTSNRRH